MTYFQRPTPIGRSLTLLTQDELPAVKQPAFVSGQSTAQLHNRYSGYQSDASFTNASNHNHTADITNSSANNTKSSIQGTSGMILVLLSIEVITVC